MLASFIWVRYRAGMTLAPDTIYLLCLRLDART
jgi:hypothetical protein